MFIPSILAARTILGCGCTAVTIGFAVVSARRLHFASRTRDTISETVVPTGIAETLALSETADGGQANPSERRA
jgi:hypothetical protein